MGCVKRESIPSTEQSFTGFEQFKNGLYNCHMPHDYNSLLGYITPPAKINNRRLKPDLSIPDARINGKLAKF